LNSEGADGGIQNNFGRGGGSVVGVLERGGAAGAAIRSGPRDYAVSAGAQTLSRAVDAVDGEIFGSEFS